MPRFFRGVLVLLGQVLYFTGLYRVVIRLNRRAPKVLLYHSCEVSESGFTRGLGGSVTPEAFAEHLDHLARHYNVVSVRELMGEECPLGAAAITFDDGFRSVYRAAFPLLKERELSATVYLVTDVIDNRQMIWVNELNWLLRQNGPDLLEEARKSIGCGSEDSVEAVVFKAALEYDPAAIQTLLDRGRALARVVDQPHWCEEQGLYLTVDEISEMSEHRITFGNHTASHPCLPRIPLERKRQEINRAKDHLTGLPGVLDSFAHPFGYVDGETRSVVAKEGYGSMLEVGGWNTPWDPRRVARIPVSGATSPGELFAEMEIVGPLKALAKRVLRREYPR